MSRKFKIRMLAEGGVMIAMATVLSLVSIIKMPFGGAVTLFSMLPILIFTYRYNVPNSIAVAVVFAIVQLLLGLKNFSYVKGAFSYFMVATFDYILAFGVLGLSGIFKKTKKQTAIIASGVMSLAIIVIFTVALLSSKDGDMIAEFKRRWWIVAVEAGVVIVAVIISLALKDKATNASVTMASGLVFTGVLRTICHFISGFTVWSEYAVNRTAIMYSLYYNLSYMIPEIILTAIMAAVCANLLDFDAELLNVRFKDDSKVKKLYDENGNENVDG